MLLFAGCVHHFGKIFCHTVEDERGDTFLPHILFSLFLACAVNGFIPAVDVKNKILHTAVVLVI